MLNIVRSKIFSTGVQIFLLKTFESSMLEIQPKMFTGIQLMLLNNSGDHIVRRSTQDVQQVFNYSLEQLLHAHS